MAGYVRKPPRPFDLTPRKVVDPLGHRGDRIADACVARALAAVRVEQRVLQQRVTLESKMSMPVDDAVRESEPEPASTVPMGVYHCRLHGYTIAPTPEQRARWERLEQAWQARLGLIKSIL